MIHYRFATLSDIDVLIDRRLQFIDAKTNSSIFFEVFRNTKEYFEKAMVNGTFDAVLAFDDDKVVGEGMISYYRLPPTSYNLTGTTANVMNLHVALHYRNNGIGGQMLQALIDCAKRKKVDVIFANATEVSEKLFQEHSFANIHNTMLYQG